MPSVRISLCGVAATLWLAVLGSGVPYAAQRQPVARPRPSPGLAQPDVRGVIDQYCVGCHNSRATSAATATGVILDRADLARIAQDGDLWEKVVRKMRAGVMPPSGMPRPDEATHAAVVQQLEAALDRAALERPVPGRQAPHRLNRAEYANAIRDLLALDVDASALLPPDDSSAGFDNNADVLGVSPALLERYLSAAANISAIAVGSPAIAAGSETYRIRGDASQTGQNDALPPGTRGGLLARHTFPLDGEYVIKVKLLEINLGAVRGLEYEHQLEVTVDGERVLLTPVGGEKDYVESSLNATNVVNSLADRLQVRVKVRAGQREVGAAFLQKPASQGGNRLQSFLRSTLIATDHTGLPHVEHVTVTGPFNATGASETASRDRIFTCRPSGAAEQRTCATDIVTRLARLAYRRPVTAADLSGLMAFYDQGRRDREAHVEPAFRRTAFEHGVELAIRGILVSPKFLFRVERDPAGVQAGAAYRLSDLELASRLSFFLWSSIPDDELLTIASSGRLRNAGVLDQQVRRMLRDPRAQALVANFAAQWLHIRNLRNATPDKNDFPDFDDNLRQAFERELELFIGSIIAEDRSVLDLLTADYTFVNERLAKHYRIPNVYGPHFRRVTLTDTPRRGLLGKGGILLVTSHADRTSPVVRGKWILDNLLGTPPPPAPADVPPFPEETPDAPQSVRARMERHRASPACAGCHRLMDPLGLALENFDAVGAWRVEDAGSPIDASGQLTDGTPVNGAIALRDALLKRSDVLVGTVSEKLLTYALGRGLVHHDMPAVRTIVRAAAQDDYRFSAVVTAIVHSTPFQMRTAGE